VARGASAGTRAAGGGRTVSPTGAWRGVLQAAKLPTIKAHVKRQRMSRMLLILLEALGAGCILVAIVWWTMFSGRGDTEAEHAAAQKKAAESEDK
jgi:hypothetical protein